MVGVGGGEHRPYIVKTGVHVAPLRIGSDVKVNTMEALALGKAIVATPAADEGIGLLPGRDLEVAELDGFFADAIVRVFNDVTHRMMLEANARKAAVELFSVAASAQALAVAYARFPDVKEVACR